MVTKGAEADDKCPGPTACANHSTVVSPVMPTVTDPFIKMEVECALLGLVMQPINN